MAKFKDKMGRYRTDSLFIERSYGNTNPELDPPFTLKEDAHEGKPSMRRLYIEIADPTEYRFAIEVLGSWEHWQRLCSAEWFQEYIEAWRKELEIKLRSEAVLKIHVMSDGENATAFQASKFLADKGWDKTIEKAKRGRPSKEEVERERRIAADMEDEISSAMDRININ